jgi:alanyl-tRNA synthetase
MSPEQLREVEALANRVVRENLSVHTEQKRYEDAIAGGALAFFGDKYADTVRVVGVCDLDLHDCFSHELCGGTHVHASGDLGAILITAETSIGAGLRRIEAVTGRGAAERARATEETLGRLSATLNTPPVEVESRVGGLRDENERLRKQIQALERRLARSEAAIVIRPEPARLTMTTFAPTVTSSSPSDILLVGDTSVVTRKLDGEFSTEYLREVGDSLKQRLGSAVILLAAAIEGKPAFLAMATPDVAKRVPAGDVVKAAAAVAGGGGGGRPELAQGGGSDVSKIDAALAAGRRFIEEKLSS